MTKTFTLKITLDDTEMDTERTAAALQSTRDLIKPWDGSLDRTNLPRTITDGMGKVVGTWEVS